jgi:hypothetical protein
MTEHHAGCAISENLSDQCTCGAAMTDPIQEIRVRRAETRARQDRGEGMADGWTEQHIDALLAEIDRLGVSPEADVMDVARNLLLELGCCLFNRRVPTQIVARALTEYSNQRVTEAIAITTSLERIEAYGDQRARETINRAAALVPPEMQQWFIDEMHGVKRVGGEVVE